MKLVLLLISLTYLQLLLAQQYPACVEKSSRNIYSAGNDTALSLFKAIPQTTNTKILIFHLRSTGTTLNIHTIAKADATGKIEWTKTLKPQNENFEIADVEVIALRDKRILVFYIARSNDLSPIYISGFLWLNSDGSLIRHDHKQLQNDVFPSTALIGRIRLKEAASGNIVFLLNIYNNGTSGLLMGNIDAAGNLLWTKILKPFVGGYGLVDFITYNNVIIVQGISSTVTYPSCAVFNNTKISLSTGDVISSTSSRDYSTAGGSASYNSVSVLTEDYKIKTIVQWRTFYYYMNYLSFTHDTSGNLLQHTVHHTENLSTSYLPLSVDLNNKGNYVIKSYGGIDNSNTSYYIGDVNDILTQQRKIENSSGFSNFKSSTASEIAFDNADSLYLYWNGNKDGKNMVGYLKTPAYPTGDFCAVKDSSFIQSDYYPMLRNWNWQLVSFATDVMAPASLALRSTSPTIQHQVICEKITGFCDPIKINPADAFCSIGLPIPITVNKNPECRGKILFRFDTAVVKSWQQPDDTTLLLWFDKSWKGKVYAIASFCPTVKDSIELTIDAPLTGIDIGNDTILCNGDILRLSPGDNFSSYTWQDASGNFFFSATKGGNYSVTVTDHCGRSYSDTIKITLIDKKVTLGADISICKMETIQLSAKGKVISYTWSPAYNVNSTSSQIISIHPEITTAYSVTALTQEGCVTKDTILVTVKDCPPDFFMPTGFTPNNDGKNDIIKPIVLAPLEHYQFSVYNRWGQRIFYTTDISKGWDGKISGVIQDTGAFVWMCTYKFYDKTGVNSKGTFMLIR